MARTSLINSCCCCCFDWLSGDTHTSPPTSLPKTECWCTDHPQPTLHPLTQHVHPPPPPPSLLLLHKSWYNNAACHMPPVLCTLQLNGNMKLVDYQLRLHQRTNMHIIQSW
jgi:hypothetical protein